jgi:FAD/FMN-containing dehydrogenase
VLAPPLPFVPDEWHGKPVIALLACWTGSIEEGEEVLRPLEGWGPIVGRGLGPMPYPVINTLFDELLPPGLRHYWKGHTAPGLPDEAGAVHLQHGALVPTAESGVFVFPLDGAAQRLAPDETAFAHRDGAFSVAIAGTWHDPNDDQRNIAWVRDYHEALLPHVREGGYGNFTMAEEQSGIRAIYGRNYDRLVELKRRYDPDNRFRFNQNIEP